MSRPRGRLLGRFGSGLALVLGLGAASFRAWEPGKPWVLMDASPDVPGCPSDVVREYDPGAAAPLEAPDDCKVELSFFPARGAPSLRAPYASLQGLEMPAEGETEPLPVPLHLVLVKPASGEDALGALRDRVQLEVKLAESILAQHRVGISLVENEVTVVEPDDPLRKVLLQKCAAVLGSPLHRERAITVIYADADTWPFDVGGWTFFGFNCAASGARNLIFLRQEHADATLAHELGHALGLNHVRPVNERNLMRCCVFGPAGEPVDELALGQAYRANFHTGSWLNEGQLRSGEVRECQGPKMLHEDTKRDWPCPSALLEGP